MDEAASDGVVRPEVTRGRGLGPWSAVLITLAIYFGTQIAAVALFLWYADWRHLDLNTWMDQSTVAQFSYLLVVQALTLLLLWRFLQSRQIKPVDIGLKKPSVSNLLFAVPIYGLYFLILIAAMAFVEHFIPAINVNQDQQIGFQNAKSGGALAFVFVSLVILPPLVEEIMVRGFLYSGLRKRLPVIKAALLTSIIFGVAHLQLGSGAPPLWVAAIDTFILSMVLIWLREQTGNIYAGMIVHDMKNLLAFLSLFIFVHH
jgi:membrane protease YdiL (CAAX protease family)